MARAIEQELQRDLAAWQVEAEEAEQCAYESLQRCEETDDQLDELYAHLRALLSTPERRRVAAGTTNSGCCNGGSADESAKRPAPISPQKQGSATREGRHTGGRSAAEDYTFTDPVTMGTLFIF